jgi:hypothetical protein
VDITNQTQEIGGQTEAPGWKPPAPFQSIPSPKSVVPALSVRQAYLTFSHNPPIKVSEVDALFTHGAHGSARLGRTKFTFHYPAGKYLLVQQRIQVGGLPAALQSGTPQTVGSCRAWTGTYPDGQNWLTFAKGNVSVLLSTNAMSPAQLATYAQLRLCAGAEAIST